MGGDDKAVFGESIDESGCEPVVAPVETHEWRIAAEIVHSCPRYRPHRTGLRCPHGIRCVGPNPPGVHAARHELDGCIELTVSYGTRVAITEYEDVLHHVPR